MATTELLPLDAWAALIYGEHRPCNVTLRRWARDGKIHPIPKKHGRSYFVHRDAQYVAACRLAAEPILAKPPLMIRIIADAKEQKPKKAGAATKPLRT